MHFKYPTYIQIPRRSYVKFNLLGSRKNINVIKFEYVEKRRDKICANKTLELLTAGCETKLLKELLQVCCTNNLDIAEAYRTFEVYMELSEVRKLSDLEYSFNESLKMFYLTGKREADKTPDIYVPVNFHNDITLEKINSIQENLCLNQKQFYLIIRDGDSSSTCYSITNSLVKPDSPSVCKKKKDIEEKKFYFDKNIQTNRKIIYSKALKCPSLVKN